MDLSTRGAYRLFHVLGVDVYVHWSWFLFAVWQVTLTRTPETEYDYQVWKAVEYISLFAVVFLHEFGHVLACRSVGGEAEQIVLWPLGGVAYVAPPPSPGAVLWSIVCGPLVNLALLLPLWTMVLLALGLGWRTEFRDVYLFSLNLALGNTLLLALNLVPIYPLDGGQILHALLWYTFGRWRSLQFVGALGILLGSALFFLGLLAFLGGGLGGNGGLSILGGLIGIIALFIVLRSLVALQQARQWLTLLALPRHGECFCPTCRISPPWGAFWVCDHCQSRFDLFSLRGKCPDCGAWYLEPDCVHCGQRSPIDTWFVTGTTAIPAPPLEPGSPSQHPEASR